MLASLLAAAGCLFGASSADRLEVHVDPRVELLTTVFRLEGAFEFNMENSTSDYSRRVDAYFKPYKNHLAVSLSDIDSLMERTPFQPAPPRWDSRWDSSEVRTSKRS